MDKITDGLKHDGGKPRLDLVPPEIIEAVGTVRHTGQKNMVKLLIGRLSQKGIVQHLCDISANG